MEKTIGIDGKEIRFKAAASFVYRYKAQFGQDILSKLMPLLQGVLPILLKKNSAVEKPQEREKREMEAAIAALEGVELTDVYNLIWVLAKTADPSIQEPEAWYDTFEDFPLLDVLTELLDVLVSSLLSSKMVKKKTGMKDALAMMTL